MTTDTIKRLLEHRKRSKAKKPYFIRQDHLKHKRRVGESWRKPKGLQSKVKLRKAGHESMPEPGWGTPALVRHLTSDGLMPIVVHRPEDLALLNKTQHGAVIGSSVGMRKRVAIIEAAQKAGITITNLKDPKSVVEMAKKDLADRKAARSAAAAKKTRSETEKKAAAPAEKKEPAKEKVQAP